MKQSNVAESDTKTRFVGPERNDCGFRLKKRGWLCGDGAGVNQTADLLPAALYLSLCACEGFSVAAGL